jgi:hypothetical protein
MITALNMQRILFFQTFEKLKSSLQLKKKIVSLLDIVNEIFKKRIRDLT